jgi:cytochrome c-type biogenesis protein CcmE
MRKLLGFLFASIFVFTVSTLVLAQESTTTKKPANEARWEGTVVRFSSDRSSFDVRQVSGDIQKTIYFDSATVWNSQYHGSKTVNKIDPSDVKEGDRVICLGTYNEKNEFHAKTISKRLSHPQ